jgi:hypothetical protein
MSYDGTDIVGPVPVPVPVPAPDPDPDPDPGATAVCALSAAAAPERLPVGAAVVVCAAAFFGQRK